MRTIEIIPYQERWAAEFAQTAAALRQALGPLALRIDHIGSTAVPGLGAKDIVDIQVTVAALDPEEPLRAVLASGGFDLLDGLRDDHRPAGDTCPDWEWRKRYCWERTGAKRTHIHIRAAGAANQRYALLCRDYLRAAPHVRQTYERIKRELARLHPHDVDAYYAVKDPVFDLIMTSAEAWAAAVGWTPGPSDA